MQRGLFNDRVKIHLQTTQVEKQEIFFPVKRVTENTNSRNSKFNLFVLMQTLGN